MSTCVKKNKGFEHVSENWFSKDRNAKAATCPFCKYQSTKYFYNEISRELDDNGGPEIGFNDCVYVTCPNCGIRLIAQLKHYNENFDFSGEPIPDKYVTNLKYMRDNCYFGMARWKLSKLVIKSVYIFVNIFEYCHHLYAEGNYPRKISQFNRHDVEVSFGLNPTVYNMGKIVSGYNLDTPHTAGDKGFRLHADNYTASSTTQTYDINGNQRVWYRATDEYRTSLSVLLTLVHNGFTVYIVNEKEGIYFVVLNPSIEYMFKNGFMKSIPEDFRLSQHYSNLGIGWEDYLEAKGWKEDIKENLI